VCFALWTRCFFHLIVASPLLAGNCMGNGHALINCLQTVHFESELLDLANKCAKLIRWHLMGDRR
jgi:hypothetical protein